MYCSRSVPNRLQTSAPVLLALAIGATPACRKPEGQPAKLTAPAFSTVETHGCDYLTQGSRCLLSSTSTIVLWTDAASGAPEVHIHGARREVRWRPVQGGLQTHVRVAPDDETLAVVSEGTRWAISIAVSPATPWLKGVKAAIAEDDIDRAKDLLAGIGVDRSVADRAVAARWQGRIAWRASRPETGRLRTAAAGIATQSGLLSLAVDEHLAAGNAHLHISGDVSKARISLDEARRVAGSTYPRGAVLADELGAQIDLSLGDRRSATRTLERMAAGAQRLDAEDIRWAAVMLGAMNLTSMGRTERALKYLETIANSPATVRSPCREALLVNHRAWSSLVATELGASVHPSQLRSDLDRALELHRTTCRDRGVELDDLLGLALFELQRGDADAAQGYLSAAESGGVLRLPRTALWYLDLAGRVALLDARPRDASRTYVRLAELAERTASADGRWRAEVGRARSLAALGNKAAAAEAYRRAEGLLEDQSLAIALEDSRGAFLANHARYTRDQVALLHAMGQTRATIATIQRARSRLLSHLDRDARLAHLSAAERASWSQAMAQIRKLRDEIDREVEAAWGLSKKKLAASEARRTALKRTLDRQLDAAVALTKQAVVPTDRAPSAGQLSLGFHRGDTGWLGFAVTASIARVKDLSEVALDGDPGDIAAGLLEPFADLIDEASLIRILASSGLEHVDFHALPWRGGYLIDEHEVVYALGLAPRSPRGTSKRALVVTDPTGNLPSARREGQAVQEALRTRGLKVLHLQSSEATALAVRTALPGVLHFHYAGHAESAQGDGWQSALLLSEEARLGPGDVLALPEVPATAFLSGCETGRTDDRAVLGLGLAQAFVLAGTAEVIASIRPVDDATTEAIARGVYSAGLDTLAPALRQAQRHLAKATPGADWAAFRVIVP